MCRGDFGCDQAGGVVRGFGISASKLDYPPLLNFLPFCLMGCFYGFGWRISVAFGDSFLSVFIYVHALSTVCPRISTVDTLVLMCHSLPMITWCPLFNQIVDSSIWGEEDFVVKIFLTMLAKKDADHIVRATAYQIGHWARKDEAIALAALKVLCSPDTRRLEPQPYEGRRIQKIEGGWLVLNGQHYQDLMRDANRRAYKAGKQKEYRAKKDVPLAGEAKYDRIHREHGQQAADAALDAVKDEHSTTSEPIPVIERPATGQAEGATPQ